MDKYSDSIEARLTARHKICMQYSEPVKGRKILNIGCYNGWFEKFAIKKRCKQVVGVDLNQKMLQQAKRGVGNAVFLKASVLSLPFSNNYFDQVVMFDVIEHLPKKTEKRCLTKINRALKENGVLVLSTPNNRFITNILDPAWFFGHRHYKLSQLSSLLQEAGFQIKRIRYGGGIVELISMIFLYVFKEFGREAPFKSYFDVLRDKEYLNNQGFVTIFIRAKVGQGRID